MLFVLVRWRRLGAGEAEPSAFSSKLGVEGLQGDLQDFGNFFGRAMIVSARCSFRWSLRFSASKCFTRGSIGRGVGPRRRPRMSRRAPCSRCRRQFAKCELYKPSRRSSAPSSPSRLHASDCLRMRSRYAAVNRRRWAFAGTSGSGAVAADVAVGPKAPRPRPSPRAYSADVERRIRGSGTRIPTKWNARRSAATIGQPVTSISVATGCRYPTRDLV